MNKVKTIFFMAFSVVILSFTAIFLVDMKTQADTVSSGFEISHSTETCGCNDSGALHSVILGSTHTYTIVPRADISFQHAIWNFTPEYNPEDNNISVSLEDGGKSVTIRFIKSEEYTLSPTMTDESNQDYQNSISIDVLNEKYVTTYSTACTELGKPLTLKAEFKYFNQNHMNGTMLQSSSDNITWSSFASIPIEEGTPSMDTNGNITFTPTQSGKYSANVSLNDVSSANTIYTVYVTDNELFAEQYIPTTGKSNEYISFTPSTTDRYKMLWKSTDNRGHESIFDSSGNQVSRIDDVYGGYWLTAGETYYIHLYYRHATTTNSYSIGIYNPPGEDDSSENPSDSESDDYTHSDVKPAPSVPSGQTTQSTGAGNNANGNSSSAQSVTVSKVKGKPKLKLKKGKVKLTFKKVKGADGYEICYATNKKFKKSKKMTVKSAKATLKKLKKGKKYFIKVRAFKRDASLKKVFGTYSKTVKITIKK